MYVGFVSGYAFRSFYDDDLKVPLFLVAGTDLLYNLAVYGLQFLLRGRLGFWTYIYRIIIPEIVYTVFLTIIVYRIFYWINYHLSLIHIYRGMVSMQGLGYKEILDWMDGNYSYEEAVRVLKRDTRHFAKRQLTWFRREGEVTWVDKDNFDYDDSRILSYMLSVCRRCV